MPATREVFSVSALNQAVGEILTDNFPLIWVEGEISNLARPASGHIYFSLKDENAQIRGAMFRGKNRLLDFNPENGDQVLVRARVSLYEPRGDYQLIVEHMEQAGDGRLRQAFEALKKKLQQDGLFNQESKQAVPSLPKRIGVITSPSGAAIRDILTVLQRRFPAIPVLIYPVAVQGKGAAEQIASAIQLANQRLDCDVLLVSRGGGSLEDLWSFNEEVVARAIHASSLPVVSAVGHEIDFTISDFTADVRAATPSAAAELLSPDQQAIQHQLDKIYKQLCASMQLRIEKYQQRLDYAGRHLQSPAQRLQQYQKSLAQCRQRLGMVVQNNLLAKKATLKQAKTELIRYAPTHRINSLNERNRNLSTRLQHGMHSQAKLANKNLANLAHSLEAVSPLATLGRGYAIVRHEEKLVRSITQLKQGTTITTQLSDGKFSAVITDVDKND